MRTASPERAHSLLSARALQLYEFVHGHRHSLDKRGKTPTLSLVLTPPVRHATHTGLGPIISHALASPPLGPTDDWSCGWCVCVLTIAMKPGTTLDELCWEGAAGVTALRVLLMSMLVR